MDSAFEQKLIIALESRKITWVTTPEPARLHESIHKNISPSAVLYRLDALSGLLEFNQVQNTWKMVIVSTEFGPAPITKLDHAIEYASKTPNSVFVLENADVYEKAIFGIIVSIDVQYSKNLEADSTYKMPVQLIMASSQPEVPMEISRFVNHIEQSLPEGQEIIESLKTSGSNSALNVNSEAAEEWIKAGVGLSSSELQMAAFELKKKFPVSPKDLKAYKNSLLKKNDILDIREPTLSAADIGGMDYAKDLIKKIASLWDNQEFFQANQVRPVRRILNVGIPGVGKSLFCEAIAKDLGLDLAKGGVSQSMNKFVGESEARVRRMFETLKLIAPIVFWIDEFGRDLSGGSSSNVSDGGTTSRVHGEFLTGLQELPDNVLLVAAANSLDDLPPEMTRADRFDKVMFTGFPTENERDTIIRINLKHIERYQIEDEEIQQLARATEYFTGAEIKALINEVNFDVLTSTHKMPTINDYIKHVPNVKGRMWVNHKNNVIGLYERALTEWHWASTEQMEQARTVIHDAKNQPVQTYTPKKANPKVSKWGASS